MSKRNDGGWVKSYRDEIYDDLWNLPEPYDSRSAYEYVKRRANFADHTTIYNGRTVTIKRGQLITSIRKLGDIFHWKKDKVRTWLERMKKLNKLEVEPDSGWTLLTVVRYGLPPIISENPDSEGYTEQTVTRHTPDTPGDSTGTQYKKNKEELKKEIERKEDSAPAEPLEDADDDDGIIWYDDPEEAMRNAIV